MRSDLVVISWWSNCLGLACLYNLVGYTRNRTICVVQVGKPEEQKERFRSLLPPAVEELPYPPNHGAEDWRVRETVACELLGDREGLWFIDHDLFVQEHCEGWLEEMDHRFSRSNVCLCHRAPLRGLAMTNPAFWLSPVRFPPGMPSFAPVPYHENPVAREPYAPRQAVDSKMIIPEKDTLVAAMEFLRDRGLVCEFPLTDSDWVVGRPAPFPSHEHLGGLYAFTSGDLPASFHDWLAQCVTRFTAFYAVCPPALVSVEDPVLMQRLEEFRQAVSGTV